MQFAMQKDKEIKTPDDLESISELISRGIHNLNQSIPGGIDYEASLNSRRFGHTNQMQTFRSFEEEINKNFDLVPTKPTHRLAQRTGVLGYKIGMTHFWDKWGKLQPCTVIQLDRCQVTQVKQKEIDGVDAI